MKTVRNYQRLTIKVLSASIISLTTLSAFAIEGTIEKEAPRSDVEVAIVPFAGAENINGVVTNDLTMGGHNVTDKNLPQNPHTSSEVKLDLWRQNAVPYLVVGRSQTDRGDVALNFEVIDVNSGAVKGTGSVLTRGRSADALRMGGHRVAERIEEILTGKKGDFSGRLAFVVESGTPSKHNQSLWVSDVDGYNPQMIQRVNGTISGLNPSANGRTFTYVVQQVGYPVVYSADVNGGGGTLLTPFRGNNLGASVSPDGSSVLFSSDYQTGKPQIYLSRGASVQRLTNDPVGAVYPSWSPDGNSFVYTSDRAGGAKGGNKGQIYRYNLSTRTEERLTGGGLSSMGKISNDGRKMSFLIGTQQGAVMDLQSRSISSVNNVGLEEPPSISPNGQHYLYSNGNMLTISTNGKTVQLRPTGIPAGKILSPIWLNPNANNSMTP